MAVKETGCVVVDWIQLAQGKRNQWLVRENIGFDSLGVM
jgi:hypothetical protein